MRIGPPGGGSGSGGAADPETIDDRVAGLLVAGANVTLDYNDAANSLTIASTAAGGGGGTVTSTSVVSANGLAGTVATATTTPAITLTTTVNGVVKGNGTALSAATAGTDYMTPANVSSGYLALGGGTLTGPLTGTTAAFSSETLTGLLTGTTAAFSGEVTALSPAAGDSDTTVATTEWVQATIAAIPPTASLLTGYWSYNSASTSPPPASGRVRLSVAWPPTVSSSLHLYIHNTDFDGFAYTWALGPLIDDILIFRSAAGGRMDALVTAKDTSSGVYLDVTVTVQSVSGTLVTNNRCAISVSRPSQPLDATLAALAAYNTNGLLTQTAADTFTGRTVTGTASRLTVTNGNGVSGNPTLNIDAAYDALWQPIDSDLTALAALGTTGMMARTAANTYATRTVTGTSSRLTVTNGDGVAGNPTLDISATYDALWQPVDADLTALAALSTTGMMARTAANTYTMRTITGTASRLSVTNGDGVSGNPTLNIDTAYVGQNTITTLGTVTTGVWNGTVVTGQYGGTGVANTGSTITLGGNFVTSGAFGCTLTVTGTTNVTLPTTGTLATTADIATIAQNAQTGNYTTVLGDAGKHIYHAVGAGAGDTYTIPANASVAYPIGTTLTFVNDDATNAVTIAITTDTLVLSPGTTTGSRTLATGGVATAIKVTSTRWIINGTGLT